MFEIAETGQKLDKSEYERLMPTLRENLLAAQAELLEQKRFPVLILINGVDGAGKGETVNALNEWMDPRHIQTHALSDPTDEERNRPEFWRHWRILPPKGKIGIFFGSWYTKPILSRVMGNISQAELAQDIARINNFERMLTNEGALILKFWFHLSKRAQRRRLKELERKKETAWRVTSLDWEHFKHYDEFSAASEHVLRRTCCHVVPWTIVEGADRRHREVTVGNAVLDAITFRLALQPATTAPAATAQSLPTEPVHRKPSLLSVLRHDLTLDEDAYSRELELWQGRLARLTRRKAYSKTFGTVVLFEGHDAAGKGGAIRRITQAIDARHVRVLPVAAPTQEERAQPYLWRFWRDLPGYGEMAIFDRSWYGRVLVERVEGFATEEAWSRAYDEINDFEADIQRHGLITIKFWMNISEDEQLRRFEERKMIGYKRFKLTEEDWRNRRKLPEYEAAASDMVTRTSTALSPWTLVEADDKSFARIKVLKTICERIEAMM